MASTRGQNKRHGQTVDASLRAFREQYGDKVARRPEVQEWLRRNIAARRLAVGRNRTKQKRKTSYQRGVVAVTSHPDFFRYGPDLVVKQRAPSKQSRATLRLWIKMYGIGTALTHLAESDPSLLWPDYKVPEARDWYRARHAVIAARMYKNANAFYGGIRVPVHGVDYAVAIRDGVLRSRSAA